MKVHSMNDRRARPLLTLLLGAFALMIASSAFAQRDHRAGPSHNRGDISRFSHPDRNAWRGGSWNHGRHDFRHDGWRVSGGLWLGYPLLYPYSYPYAYTYPYSYAYPYPYAYAAPPAALVGPSQTVEPAAPPTAYWYYCEESRTYYPYVASCPGGWRAVPAAPSDAAPVPPQ